MNLALDLVLIIVKIVHLDISYKMDKCVFLFAKILPIKMFKQKHVIFALITARHVKHFLSFALLAHLVIIYLLQNAIYYVF